MRPVVSTGIGSWPGTSMRDAIAIAFAECPDLPYLPELPARGPHTGMIGRATALLAGLNIDLQSAGWRLADASGREHRLARATLRADLDELEEAAQEYAGPLTLTCAGPWTLAASIERPRGDRLLADTGARRDVAHSLAEGLADLLVELRRRLPAVAVGLQLDEPLLPAVVAGGVRTASGLGRHRAVDRPEISGAYSYLVERLTAVGVPAPLAVHCCAAGTPIELLHRSGIRRLSLDIDQLRGSDWDVLAGRLEAGLELGLGALPTGSTLGPDAVAGRVLRPVRDLGLDPAGLTLLITPACGLAGVDPRAAVRALRTVRRAAELVTDQLER